MNDQNEPAQLRFLEETAIRLRQNGFTVCLYGRAYIMGSLHFVFDL